MSSWSYIHCKSAILLTNRIEVYIIISFSLFCFFLVCVCVCLFALELFWQSLKIFLSHSASVIGTSVHLDLSNLYIKDVILLSFKLFLLAQWNLEKHKKFHFHEMLNLITSQVSKLHSGNWEIKFFSHTKLNAWWTHIHNGSLWNVWELNIINEAQKLF